MSWRPTVDRLREQWPKLFAMSPRKREEALTTGVGLPFSVEAKEVDLIARGERCDLGIAVRMTIIEEILTNYYRSDGIRRKIEYILNEHGASREGDRWMEGMFRWRSEPEELSPVGKFGRLFNEIELRRAVGAAINKTFTERDPSRRAIDCNELFERELLAKTAIDDYLEWLKKGPVPPATGEEFLNDVPSYYDYPDRKQRIKDLVTTVQSRDEDAPFIINVHQTDMWYGLSAVARELCEGLKASGCRLPLCYIPLGRVPVAGDPPVNYPRIAAYLKAFYQNRKLSDAPRLLSANDIEDALLFVRQQMLTVPAVFIFDGYVAEPESFETVKALIRDDDVMNIVVRMLTPYMWGTLETLDYERFRANRIVILSDREIRLTRASGIFLRQHLAKCIEMPMPETPGWKESLSRLRLCNEAEIVALYRSVRSLQENQFRSENLLRLIDAVIGVEKAVHEWEQQAFARRVGRWMTSPDLSSLAAMKKLVVTHMHGRLKSQPLWLLVLSFVATAPDGVRIATMERLVSAWYRLQACGPMPWAEPIVAADTERVAETMAAILKELRSIMARRKKDLVYALDDAVSAKQHPQGSMFADDEQLLQTTLIDFSLPEVRALLLSAIVAEKGYRAIRAMHALLAEESMRQQTIMMRHADDGSLHSIRGYRRLVQALYHGLLALPDQRAWQEESSAPRKVSADAFATIPQDPIEGWRWLAVFAFRHVLERPPLWQLSRVFGADRLKLELLDLIEKPARGREVNPKGGGPGLELLSAALASANRAELEWWQREILVSKAQASYTVERNYSPIDIERAALTYTDPMIRKQRFDLLLIRDEYDLAQNLAETEIKQICADHHAALLDQVAELTERLGQIFSGQQLAADAAHAHATSVADFCSSLIAGRPLSEVAILPDFLNRYGEAIAVRADLRHARTAMAGQSVEAARALRNAFAWFCLGNSLRDECAKVSGFASRHLGSAHGTRVMIRTALKLERLAGDPEPREKQCGYFAKCARHLADRLTQDLFNYGRERASLLIIESAISRMLTGARHELEALRLSRHCLEKAERIVQMLDARARVRMRLRLERAKVNRRLAVLARSDKVERSRAYLRMAMYDAEVLRHEASVHDSQLWKALAEQQCAKNSRAEEVLQGSSVVPIK